MTIDHDEITWVRDRRPEPTAPDAEATLRARSALLEHIAEADARPARAADAADAPVSIARADRRPRRAGRPLLRLSAIAAAAAVAVTVAVSSLPGSEDAGGGALVPASAEASTFATLVARFGAQPALTGDATLVLRSHRTNERSFTGADLFGDDGRYVYAPTLRALRSRADRTEGGPETRSLAAAAAAATALPPRVARERLLRAGGISLEQDPQQIDTLVWTTTMEALKAGAGRADVRAGAMKLFGTLPDVELRRTATAVEVINGDYPDDYRETLTVDARSGVPVRFEGGSAGQAPDVVVDYDVKRVEAKDVLGG